MENSLIICIIFIIILSIIIIGLIVYTTTIKSSLIDPQNCSHVTGSFGLQVQKSGITANFCGSNKDILCNFNDVLDLATAINYCNGVEECQAFVYNQNNHVMSIINVNEPTFEDLNYNLFTRQNTIILE